MKHLLASLFLAVAWTVPAADPSHIDIKADEFEFSSEKKVGVYTGNVRLIDPPDMELTCHKLTSSLPVSGGGIERIIAEENVVIKLYEMQGDKRVLRTAKGKRAVYEAASNRVTLTGDPYIEVTEGKLTADEVILDRNSGLLRAKGSVHMVLDEAALSKSKTAPGAK